MFLGWIFPIVFVIMMVLCFLMMGRRACGGPPGGWCLGHRRQAPNEDEETASRGEADRRATWKRETVPPVTPR